MFREMKCTVVDLFLQGEPSDEAVQNFRDICQALKVANPSPFQESDTNRDVRSHLPTSHTQSCGCQVSDGPVWMCPVDEASLLEITGERVTPMRVVRPGVMTPIHLAAVGPAHGKPILVVKQILSVTKDHVDVL